jgi:uncharacterized protein (DUF849 family)
VIKQRSGVVVNITTGGSPTMTVEERVQPAAKFKPEIASLNVGTMNFRPLSDDPALQGKFKHDREELYLEGTRKGMFNNMLADTEYILTTPAPGTAPASRSSATIHCQPKQLAALTITNIICTIVQ